MNYDYIIRLQDLMSGPLARITSVYSSQVSRWDGLTTRFKSGFARATQTVDALRSKLLGLRPAGNSIDGLNQKLDALTKRRNISVDTSEIKRLNREIQATENSLNKLKGAGTKGSGGGMMAMALPYLGAAAIASGVAGLAHSGIEREQTKVGYSQYMGNGTDAMMGKLDTFANVTPFTNKEVYGAGQSMLAVDFKAKELIPEMTNIGNMAAGAQKDFGELTKGYAKIKAKGFIDSGELHQEFGGTRLMDQLKKNLGLNGEGLFKAAEAKKIKFEDVQKAISDLSANGGAYNGAMDKQSQTAGGKLSTLLGTAETTLAKWAEKMNPMLGKLFDFGTKVIEGIGPALEKVTPYLMQLWDATAPLRALFSDVAAAVWELVSGLGGMVSGGGRAQVIVGVLAAVLKVASNILYAIGEVILWIVTGPLKWLTVGIGGLIAAWKIFNLVVAMNPFTIWLTVLALVVTGITYAWDNIDGFREAILRCWNVLKGMFSAVGPILQALFVPSPDNISAAIDAVKKGWSTGMANGDASVRADRAERAAAKATKLSAVAAKAAGAGGAGAGADAADAGAGGGIGQAAGLTGTTGGGKSTSITINLKSLVENLTIQASSVKGGIDNMEQQVEDALLRVLYGANASV